MSDMWEGRFDSEERSLSARQSMYETLTSEIEQLVSKLTHINDEMSDVVGSSGTSSSSWASNPAVQHTLRRHRDILRDYGTEFRRAKENVKAQLDREFLTTSSTSNGNQSSENLTCLNNRAKASDLYLKENDHINSCDRLIAMSTKENLARQGYNMRGISKKLDQMTKKYPMINNLMLKIQTKKRKDAIIMAGVISACFIFTIWYVIA
ncbi:hypothetical protein WR25_06017 [Diploscapter pachys]|uniref:Golgi SNAP receptor complex member 1 n=1 Tax=Diploscapter pachys TaxID=2018661 RepID=A0A2A2LQE4_9BILA|nr:hypothetical protein WR25_06017 [Diploscapter pachys]